MESIYEEILRLSNLSINQLVSKEESIEIYCEVNEKGKCPSCGEVSAKLIKDMSE